jgi:hypothetical protein
MPGLAPDILIFKPMIPNDRRAWLILETVMRALFV